MAYLRMSLDNSHSPCPMRFFGVCPEELVMFIVDLDFLLLCLDGEALVYRLPRRDCRGSYRGPHFEN